jgi:hypothetical protein
MSVLQPFTDDGKPISLVNAFPGDVNVNFCGVGDDIAGGVRFAGQLFMSATALVEDKVTEWQHMEWVYMAGGALTFSGAKFGDHVSYEVFAPATAGTSVPATGQYAKQAIGGGASRFIPQVNGLWDLDLAEKLNANVGFTKVVLIPSETGTGYFDWNDETEVVTQNADGKGKFNLLDVPVTLSKFVSKVPLIGPSGIVNLMPGELKPKKILAHWKHKITLHHAVTDTLELGWFLYTARKKTT